MLFERLFSLSANEIWQIWIVSGCILCTWRCLLFYKQWVTTTMTTTTTRIISWEYFINIKMITAVNEPNGRIPFAIESNSLWRNIKVIKPSSSHLIWGWKLITCWNIVVSRANELEWTPAGGRHRSSSNTIDGISACQRQCGGILVLIVKQRRTCLFVLQLHRAKQNVCKHQNDDTPWIGTLMYAFNNPNHLQINC